MIFKEKYLLIFFFFAGTLSGNRVVGVKFVLTDGASHMVDSSDWAFHQATQTAIGKKTCLEKIGLVL